MCQTNPGKLPTVISQMFSVRVDSGKVIFWAAVLFLGAIFLSAAPVIVADTNDDAFIYLRYVQNILNDDGAVFNPGERVEGFSSPLWLGILTALHYLADSTIWHDCDAFVLSQSLSTVFTLLTAMMLIYWGLFFESIKKRYVVVAVLLFLGVPETIVWARSGMETSMVAFLLLSSVFYTYSFWSTGRKKFQWMAVLSLTCLGLARPETIVFVCAIILLTHFFVEMPGKRSDFFQSIKIATVKLGILPMFSFLSYLVWRRIYYEQWLPNTYFAKRGCDWVFWWRGVKYITEYLMQPHLWVGLTFIAMAIVWGNRRIVRFIVLILLMGVGIIVLEGGDFLWHWRFAYPYLPLVIIAGLIGLHFFSQRWQFRGGSLPAMLAGILWCVWGVGSLFTDRLAERAHGVHLKHENTAAIANCVSKTVQPRETIAVGPAGRFVFIVSPYKAFDFWGLVVPEIAHSKRVPGKVGHERWNTNEILKKKPDYIFWTLQAKPKPMCSYLKDEGRGALFSSKFKDFLTNPNFVFAVLPMHDSGEWFHFLVGKDVIDKSKHQFYRLSDVCEQFKL
ncbi:MAG: hypothetical protein JXX14_02730 [Deltaproteobacteria bacterium]|nr:hypothetical protein [Deltaproteobacteria bacterium]